VRPYQRIGHGNGSVMAEGSLYGAGRAGARVSAAEGGRRSERAGWREWRKT